VNVTVWLHIAHPGKTPSMDPSKKQLIASVFAGGGEIGARMRALDWLSCFSERAFLSAD